MDTENRLHTEKPIREYYQLTEPFSETVSATLYKGIHTSKGVQVMVWVSKYPFEVDSSECNDFVNKIRKIDEIDPPISSMEQFGIDSDGFAFVVFPSSMREQLLSDNIEIMEKYRRYFQIIRKVEVLHSLDISFGDISVNSFMGYDTASFDFSALIGIPKKLYEDGYDKISPLLLQFCAPELISSASSNKKADIFSLGVLGFYLFKEDVPFNIELENSKAVYNENEESFLPDDKLPEAFFNVFRKAIAINPKDRYSSVSELVESLVGAKEKIEISSRKTTAIKSPMLSKSLVVQPTIAKPLKIDNDVRKSAAYPMLTKITSLKSMSIFISVFLVIIAGIYLFFQTASDRKLSRETKEATLPFTAGSSELTNSVNKITDISAGAKEKVDEIRKLSRSADPISYSLLLANAKEAKDPFIKSTINDAIVDKLKKEGFLLTSSQVNQWLRYSKVDSTTNLYSMVIKSSDPVVPLVERAKYLDSLLQEDLNIGLRLLSALYFDLDLPNEFENLFEKYLGNKITKASDTKVSPLVLIILHDGLSPIFSTNIKASLETLTNKDIKEVLPVYAKRNDEKLIDLINIAKERNLYSEKDLYLINIVKEEQDLKLNVLQALISIVDNSTDKSDISSLSAWSDTRAEDALILLINKINDEDLVEYAVDVVAALKAISEPANGIINWLKEKKWENRVTYAKSFSILSKSEYYTNDEILNSLEVFKKGIKNRSLLNSFVKSGDIRIIKGVLSKYGKEITLAQKLNLIKNKNPQIRKLVIPVIDTNDVGAMKLLVDSFEREKDLEVKQIFRDNFWFLKNR